MRPLRENKLPDQKMLVEPKPENEPPYKPSKTNNNKREQKQFKKQMQIIAPAKPEGGPNVSK